MTPPRTTTALLALCTTLACERASRDATDSATTSSNTADSTTSARVFLQSFYDWYAPLGSTPSASYVEVLTRDTLYITPELALALRADSAARVDESEPRETFNADPFLASNDPCSLFTVTDVVRDNAAFRATVRPICAPGAYQQDPFSVLLEPTAKGWRIADVVYDSTKLTQLLCQYAMADTRVALRPTRCE